MPSFPCQKGFIQTLVLIVLIAILVAGGAYYWQSQTNFSPSPSPLPTSGQATPTPTAQECKVAGCSGQVCAEAEEAEEIITDCEWKTEYACYKQVCNPPGCKTARCERQPSGECGWTQDETLIKCLEETSSSF